MKYFSTFTGVGGFELGITQAYEILRIKNKEHGVQGIGDKKRLSSELNYLSQDGFTCVGYSEIDKYAVQVLRYHYPTIKNYGNIKDINWSEVPDFDLLVGGSPCQDFSIAGKRAGVAGERSGLVWEYIRALEEKKPQHFIWENVKGVMSSRNGHDFANILTAFSEAGYSLQWQVLNAKDFGVPQNRERVFVIGTRGGSGPEVFFDRGAESKDIQNLEPGADQASRLYDTEGVSPTIPTAGGGRHIPMIYERPL